jgi:hypothetical protein
VISTVDLIIALKMTIAGAPTDAEKSSAMNHKVPCQAVVRFIKYFSFSFGAGNMLAPDQQLAVGALIAVWLVFTAVYGSARLTCSDRREVSLAFAILTSPFYALSVWFYVSKPCFLTGLAFGMLQTFLIYLIIRYLLPCKGSFGGGW